MKTVELLSTPALGIHLIAEVSSQLDRLEALFADAKAGVPGADTAMILASRTLREIRGALDAKEDFLATMDDVYGAGDRAGDARGHARGLAEGEAHGRAQALAELTGRPVAVAS